MYDAQTGKGVLNDFDLAFYRHQTGETSENRVVKNRQRVGTMPFMALELLVQDGWQGQAPRLYRHSAESFAWTLLWICGRYINGESKPPIQVGDNESNNGEVRQFDRWLTHSYGECHARKLATASTLARSLTIPDPNLRIFRIVMMEQIKHWRIKFSQLYDGWDTVTQAETNREIADKIAGIVETGLSNKMLQVASARLGPEVLGESQAERSKQAWEIFKEAMGDLDDIKANTNPL
jgi:hypothetical protein